MCPLKIVVKDKKYGDAIARDLKEFYGDRVTCYTNSVPMDTKIDFFFVSGKEIVDGADMHELRASKGAERCRIIAISSFDNLVEQIQKNREFGADFAINKFMLMDEFCQSNEVLKQGRKTFLNMLIASV